MRLNKQSGQVLVGTAVALVVLCGFAGLALDMGTLRYQKRLQQTAADAAAIAGAQNLNFGSGVTAGAQYASTQNGFTDTAGGQVSSCTAANAAVGTVCIQVNNPPAAGPHSGDAKYVEALVAEVQPTFFMKIFGVNSEAVTARAVATNISGGANQTCMWTLGPPTSAIVGLDATGNAKIIAPNCGISDNGNLDTTGNSYTVEASTISVSGQCLGSHCGSPDVQCTATGGTCPPIGGSAASPDPLCATPSKCIKPPSMPAYSVDCPHIPPAGTCDYSSNKSTSNTIHPGAYNSINFGSNSTITMLPGIYYINGSLNGSLAGINFSGGATLISQGYAGGSNPCGTAASPIDGVMIYFTNTSTMNKFVGGGNNPDLRLCPLDNNQSTTYEGMLMYQNPADTTQAWIGGDNNTVLNGTVYMPTATLNFYGNTSFTFNGPLIAYSVATTGNPTVTLGTGGGATTPAYLTQPILVE